MIGGAANQSSSRFNRIKIDTAHDSEDETQLSVDHELPVAMDVDSDDEFWERMAKNKEPSPVKKKAHV